MTPRQRTIIDGHMQEGYFRYEVVRRLNVHQFGVIFERNILGGIRFDYMIDRLRELTPDEQVELINAWERENHAAKCKANALTELTQLMDKEGVYDRKLEDEPK